MNSLTNGRGGSSTNNHVDGRLNTECEINNRSAAANLRSLNIPSAIGSAMHITCYTHNPLISLTLICLCLHQSASTTGPTTRSMTTMMTMPWKMKRCAGPGAGTASARGQAGGAAWGTRTQTSHTKSTGCRRPSRNYGSSRSWWPWCR